jgi:hypothetical protein
MVLSEPSWPVFIAWIISNASSPLTSPTTIRSGPHAEGVPNQVTLGDGSSAFDVWRAGFEADDVVLL